MAARATNRQRETALPPLRELRVELLRGCPLLCAHCSAHAAPLHPLRLPLERALTLLDEFAELGGHRVTLTGGEPLTYPGLEVVLRRCRELGLTAHLFSSGVILAGGARRAVNSGMLGRLRPYHETIAYSVYAATPAVHDEITLVPGSHGMTVEAVRRTVALGMGTEFHFVPTRRNWAELPGVVALASSLEVPMVRVLRFVPHGRGGRRGAGLALDGEAHQGLRQAILGLRAAHPDVALRVGSAYNLLDLGDPGSCGSCGEQLVIGADGGIAPCSAFGGFRVDDEWDNILRHPLRAVWEHSAFLAQVRSALATTEGCVGCLAQKSLVAGRIDASVPDPLAALLRRQDPWTAA